MLLAAIPLKRVPEAAVHSTYLDLFDAPLPGSEQPFLSKSTDYSLLHLLLLSLLCIRQCQVARRVLLRLAKTFLVPPFKCDVSAPTRDLHCFSVVASLLQLQKSLKTITRRDQLLLLCRFAKRKLAGCKSQSTVKLESTRRQSESVRGWAQQRRPSRRDAYDLLGEMQWLKAAAQVSNSTV